MVESMNSEEIEMWKDDVMVHCQTITTVLNDRRIIKKVMENHLREFFDYDMIEFDKDFNVITLKWSYDNEPTIKPHELLGLGMDFVISSDFSEELGLTAIIKIYPFGVPNDCIEE